MEYVKAISLLCSGLVTGYLLHRYTSAAPTFSNAKKAVVTLHPTESSVTRGTINFEQLATGIHIHGTISGLKPGKHGFHIHTFGNCSCPDATCAGGHFNPTNQPHGAPSDKKRHVGDLGNIIADNNGTASIDAMDSIITLNGPHSIIGRSVIVHEQHDNLTSQPTGSAGKRVGCGVIGFAK